MTLKEPPKGLPQIDAVRDFNPSPEYAGKILDQLLKHYTLRQIAAHTGICKRLISYFRQRGFGLYTRQLAMEIMAGKKKLAK